jgi:hypothetical protein
LLPSGEGRRRAEVRKEALDVGVLVETEGEKPLSV